VAVKSRLDIRNRPRIPIPDEDPYSVAGSGSSGSSSGAGKTYGAHLHQQKAQKHDKPPKLPPRDVAAYPHDIPKVGYLLLFLFPAMLLYIAIVIVTIIIIILNERLKS
jgi:hypothetical protein